MADSNATKNDVVGHEDHWKATATKSGLYEFKTGGTFVDRNIDFTVPAAVETASGTASGTASANIVAKVGNKVDGKYKIVADSGTSISGSITGTATASVTTPGFTDSNSYSGGAGSITGTISGTASVSGDINPIALSASGSASGTISSITVGTKSGNTYAVSGSGSLSGTAAASITSSGYGTTETGSGSVTGTATVNTTLPVAKMTGGTTVTNASSEVITRGTYDVTSEGYVKSGDNTLAAAQFLNEGTDGVTYVDISKSGPVLKSGDGLYINKGYVDNLYISLKQLSPDGASDVQAIKDGMLDSISAYDNDGNLVTGNIPTKSSADLTASGKTVTVAPGYYKTTATKDVATGSVNDYKINQTAQAGVLATVTDTAPTSGYYPVKVASLTGTVNRTEGYISGTTSTAADIEGGVVGKIIAGSASGATSGVIPAGGTYTVGVGYYGSPITVTAEDSGAAIVREAITNNVTTTASEGYYAPSLLDTAPTAPYVTISGQGTMTAGHIFNGTSTPKTGYIKIYTGQYTVS